MDKTEKLARLQDLDEETLTKRFLIPLLSKMGCKNIKYTHGSFEQGIDILYCIKDEFKKQVYTGVQVKAIDVTSRNIDTVRRQITEALGTTFLYGGKKRKLDKIVLVTSKEFKGKSEQSLLNSLVGENQHLQRVITFIDGNQLIDHLDEYLPSAFWEEYDYFNRYFSAMKKKFETIKDVSAFGQKEPIPLEEIYVSLQLSETPKREVPTKKEMEREHELMEKEIEREHLLEKERYKKQILDADDAAKKFDKTVIVGAPGSGKTTLLKHLALKSCKENLEKHQRMMVPVFIELRLFSESDKNLREYIDDVVEQYDFPKAQDFIEKDLKEGRCQLLLDGFDELATKERQLEVARKVEAFIQGYPKNQFILTSRIAGYNDELKIFQKLEILEFNDQQIEKFITNWFGTTNPEKASAMNRTLKKHEKIRKIARNPLMIAIIAVIYEEGRKLPQRRVELYQKCVDVLLSRWDVQYKIKNKYESKAKEKILRKLALEVHVSEKRTFERDELLKRFFEYLPEVRIKEEEAGNVLDEIVKRNALLKEVSIGVYDFLHLSFQEYFAALELREEKDYETLLEHLYDPWWEEVVLLFAGFDRNATKLLQMIQEKEKTDERFREDIFCSNLMLMGKCIADADYTDLQIREQITTDLWELYTDAEFFLLSEEAIKVLRLIKPENIIDSLIEDLKSESSDVRWRAAIALGTLGSEKAVDPLINTLTTHESSDVRWRAAEALGTLGSEKAVDPLIKTLTTHESSDVRERAAIALGTLGSEKAVDPLKKALKDKGIGIFGKVRDASFRSLLEISKKTKKRIL